MNINIKDKGLDIPIKGNPSGAIQELTISGHTKDKYKPKTISLNLQYYDDSGFKLHKAVGDKVKIGEAIAEDKGCEGRMFVSPAAGTITEIRRGLKRKILDIIIELADTEDYMEHGTVNIESASREEILKRLLAGGIFSKIHQRPFCMLADPKKTPRSIFVKAIESAPFTPPAEMQVEGHEQEFQIGLKALKKLTDGAVHLVYRKGTLCHAFTDATDVEKHTAEGPHPIGTHSVHIEKIDQITSPEDVVWTANVNDVIGIGKLLSKGRFHCDRIVSIAGPGILEGQTGYFRLREGFPISDLVEGRIAKKPTRFISGDPLMGHKVEIQDYLGPDDYVFCAIPEDVEREFLHFFRLGLNKYSHTRAYLSGHLNNKNREYDFTTSQHGEKRAFIDPAPYDSVMPLSIPTMELVKAVMSENYELADDLGFLEVHPEDFALPTFVCISKIDMVNIIRDGLKAHAIEMLK
jgi:Na+-transporting NADH:ubiquinone oxidoreductase subunit A